MKTMRYSLVLTAITFFITSYSNATIALTISNTLDNYDVEIKAFSSTNTEVDSNGNATTSTSFARLGKVQQGKAVTLNIDTTKVSKLKFNKKTKDERTTDDSVFMDVTSLANGTTIVLSNGITATARTGNATGATGNATGATGTTSPATGTTGA